MKKKIICLLVFLISTITGCQDNIKAPEVKIDYGTSSIYTEEDMDAAIEVIKEKFNEFEGFEFHSISYTSDTESTGTKVNDKNDNTLQHIAFKSDFHSPKNGPVDGWNVDYEYTDWKWELIRNADGTWDLINWGFG